MSVVDRLIRSSCTWDDVFKRVSALPAREEMGPDQIFILYVNGNGGQRGC